MSIQYLTKRSILWFASKNKMILSCIAVRRDTMYILHACVVLNSKNFKKEFYCSDLYKSKTVFRTHDISIYPLPHKDDLVISHSLLDDVVLPPKYKQPPSRPSKKDCGKSERDMFEK